MSGRRRDGRADRTSVRFRAMPRRDAFIEHLAEVPLFSALLARKDLSLVARRAEDVTVPAGKVLVKRGRDGPAVLRDHRRHGPGHPPRPQVATLGPGDSFGELALLDRRPRNATVSRRDADGARRARPAEFAGLIDEVPGFARKLLAGLAERLRAADMTDV